MLDKILYLFERLTGYALDFKGKRIHLVKIA